MSIELEIFIACALIQCLYYLIVFARLNFVRPFSSIPEHLPPTSVIICAKNEEQNLSQNLKVVLIQQYKQYEVIVVNDGSEDKTMEVLEQYGRRNNNLKIIHLDKGREKIFAGKKDALIAGIRAAAFDTIVVTDADCRPASTRWLAKIVGAYMSETEIVLAHAPYEKQRGLLNYLIRYENCVASFQYLGFAKLGLPYMGVGRNLSYQKNLFNSFKGFEKTGHLLSGDDDLFINAVANGKNTEVCIDDDTFAYSKAKTTFVAWINQKRRHLRSAFRFKFHHMFLLFLFALTNFLFYVGFIFLLAKGALLKVFLSVFIGTLMVKLVSTLKAYKKLGSGDLLLLSPALDVAYTGYTLLIFFLLLLKPKKLWN